MFTADVANATWNDARTACKSLSIARWDRGRVLTASKQPLHISYTDKKEKKIFLIYKEIQNGAVAKSYMMNGFLIYKELHKYLTKYEEAVSYIWLCNCSILNFLTYEENVIVLCFISVAIFRMNSMLN